jgi:hypothetical protein
MTLRRWSVITDQHCSYGSASVQPQAHIPTGWSSPASSATSQTSATKTTGSGRIEDEEIVRAAENSTDASDSDSSEE